MEAHLYIMAESFEKNPNFSNSDIEEKIMRLAEDVRRINISKDSNKLFANYTALYPLIFHSTFTIEDFLCRPIEVKKIVDRDCVNALINIFEKAVNTPISSDEVRQTLLPWHDENVCHGLIAFHNVNGIPDEFQLIYGIDRWYKFRRHFLGIYPNEETFINECEVYFPNLFFHSRNKTTVKDIIKDFSICIVSHLEALNDVLFTYRERKFDNESIKYQTLTSECHLPENAASKDKNDAKENLTFGFINDEGNLEEVTCYPHLRLCRSNKEGDSKYYHHRIYFHEGLPKIQQGNILIGHIGVHL